MQLYELLAPEEPVDRLTKAELARELGWFDRARELLDWPWPEEYRHAADRIRMLAEEGDPEVRELTSSQG